MKILWSTFFTAIALVVSFTAFTVPVVACDDYSACNYDGNSDNYLCEYESCQTCSDSEACNYGSYESCEYESCQSFCDLYPDDPSCTSDPCDDNPDDPSCQDFCTQYPEDPSCQEDEVFGCMEADACNQNLSATEDDGSCDYSCWGCTDSSACNYNFDATRDDGSCNHALCGSNDIEEGESENLCPEGETLCADGSCTPGVCPVTYICSSGATVYDPAECGVCENGGTLCADGSCSQSCPETYLCSDGRLVLNQSECSVSCGAGEFCCPETLMCVADGNEAECPDPAATGQCNASLTTLSPSEVTIGSPLADNMGCSYGTGGPVSASNDPQGDPIYLWSCVGTEGSTSCMAEVEQCPAETPTYCYGSCISGSCEPPEEPGPNEGLGGDSGKVILNANLKVTPIIDPGSSCEIRWDRDAFGTNQGVFIQSTTTTRCSFSDQSETFFSFDVTDLNAPTSMTHENVIRDENYVLKCWETDDPSWEVASSTGSCRLNVRPLEFN